MLDKKPAMQPWKDAARSILFGTELLKLLSLSDISEDRVIEDMLVVTNKYG